jgi:hypothetical protein
MINFDKFVFAQQQQTATVDKDTLMATIANDFILITENNVRVFVSEQTFDQCLKAWSGTEESVEEGAE